MQVAGHDQVRKISATMSPTVSAALWPGATMYCTERGGVGAISRSRAV